MSTIREMMRVVGNYEALKKFREGLDSNNRIQPGAGTLQTKSFIASELGGPRIGQLKPLLIRLLKISDQDLEKGDSGIVCLGLGNPIWKEILDTERIWAQKVLEEVLEVKGFENEVVLGHLDTTSPVSHTLIRFRKRIISTALDVHETAFWEAGGIEGLLTRYLDVIEGLWKRFLDNKDIFRPVKGVKSRRVSRSLKSVKSPLLSDVCAPANKPSKTSVEELKLKLKEWREAGG